MHIPQDELQKFQDGTMNTDEMIHFLEHMDQCDFCLEQLLQDEETSPEHAPAYLQDEILKKQRHGFWVFIFSLIPGAGEMYMGFKKKGISIMLLFWGVIALASLSGMGWLAMFLPVIWFYSFFNVHNLKSLSEEEFYSVEDNYVLHMDQFSSDIGKLLRNHRRLTAWILILFGICILWSCFTDILYMIVPVSLIDYAYDLCRSLPQMVIAIGIIAAGIYLLTQQKKKLEEEEETKDEHYWEPYRQYQQADTKNKIEESAPAASEDSNEIIETTDSPENK